MLRPFFIIMLMSSGLMRSGTVHPSRSYSAMHCSAKPLYFADWPDEVGGHQRFHANPILIAKVTALVEPVPAAELSADRVPHQLHELDAIHRGVAIRAAHELIEIFANFRHLEILRV